MDNIYGLVIIGVLAVVFVLMIARQKRQEKRNIEALNMFKVGDKVVTHIGIYGRIKRIYNTSYGKTCILEIGNDNKVDIEIDMRYIAGYDEKVAVADNPQPNKTELKENKNENNKPKTEKKSKESSKKTKSNVNNK